MKLTDRAIRAAKARERPYKLADGGGLYVEVFPNGSKLWRLKYRRPGGKETRVSLGPYGPDGSGVPIAQARAKREQLKQQRREGVDPAIQRRTEKARRHLAASNTFEAIAREWLAKLEVKASPGHLKRVQRRLERDLFPFMGGRPIAEIEADELLTVLRKIETRGTLDTAHRARGDCGSIFRYAIATGRAKQDLSVHLRGSLASPAEGHFATITKPAEAGALLRAIRGYTGTNEVRAALQLAPLTFVRPGELRQAEWTEVDLDAKEWRIPAAKMKMRVPHIVPLSEQAVEILRDLHLLTGKNPLVFPGVRSLRRPMSENTINAALRRLGYPKDQMTGHGFRHMASTLLNEQGWSPDAIERQLAHRERNKIRATYNFAEFLPERRKMMQAWADYLDALREDRKVVAGNFGRAA